MPEPHVRSLDFDDALQGEGSGRQHAHASSHSASSRSSGGRAGEDVGEEKKRKCNLKGSTGMKGSSREWVRWIFQPKKRNGDAARDCVGEREVGVPPPSLRGDPLMGGRGREPACELSPDLIEGENAPDSCWRDCRPVIADMCVSSCHVMHGHKEKRYTCL